MKNKWMEKWDLCQYLNRCIMWSPSYPLPCIPMHSSYWVQISSSVLALYSALLIKPSWGYKQAVTCKTPTGLFAITPNYQLRNPRCKEHLSTADIQLLILLFVVSNSDYLPLYGQIQEPYFLCNILRRILQLQ